MGRRDQVEILFLGDSRSAQRAIGQLQGSLNKQQTQLGRTSQSLTRWGDTLTKRVTLPIIAAGGAFLAAGDQMDKAQANIRAGTGATGEALDALMGDFEEVAKQVPQSFDEVSNAVADLNTRTGQTGQGLQELAKAELDLADLTKEDVKPQIEATTRLFGDWGVATDEQVDRLDLLWRTSQTTGIGVTDLSNKLVQFGAPLRQLGFDLETSAALLGSFEREGVNTELVLGSLRIALGKMAREGEPAVETFRRVVGQIDAAGDASEANALALELFDARAGPDMAAAIREGRFEIDELLTQLRNGTETIASADAETQTLGESLAIMRNQATLAAAPLGQSLVGAMQELMPLLEGAIGLVAGGVDVFMALPAPVRDGALAMLALVAAVGPLMSVGGRLIKRVDTIVDGTKRLHRGLAIAAAMSGRTAPSLAKVAAGVTGIGLAIGLAVTAFTIWSRAKAEARRRVQELQESLDESTGAITENTDALILNRLEQDGVLAKARELGIGADVLTDAMKGNTAAFDDVVTRLHESGELSFDTAKGLATLREEIEQATTAGREMAEAAAEQRGELADLQHGIDRGLDPALAAIALRHQGAEDATDDHTGAQEDLGAETEETTRSLKGQADQLRAMTDPIFAAQKATADLDEAQRNLEQAQIDGTASAEELAQMKREVAERAIAAGSALGDLRDDQGNLITSTEDLRDELARLGVPPDVIDQMVGDFNTLKGELSILEQGADIPVVADTSQARQDLAALRGELERLRAAGFEVSTRAGGGVRGGVTEHHGGGIIGRGPLRPDEEAFIGLKGEEVLREDDPRHIDNLRRGGPGRGSGAMTIERGALHLEVHVHGNADQATVDALRDEVEQALDEFADAIVVKLRSR